MSQHGRQGEVSVRASETSRVLSVQSHVVHGYVGNKSAVFPLQLLGFEVDSVNTVHFSNHTGYPSFKGTVMTGEELRSTMEGLEANGLVDHTHLLTGYIGSESVLAAVVEVLGAIRQKNPRAVYVCDPVLGDHGRIYTKPELVEVYRQVVVPLANVLTPNQFELELLTGREAKTDEDILRCVDDLHRRGPETVVVTSIDDAQGEHSEGSEIRILASTTRPQDDGLPSRFTLSVPKLGSHFTGSGDLTAALLLAWTTETPARLREAVLRTVSSVYEVLRDTAENGEGNERAFMKTPELRLVQNQDAIRSPRLRFSDSVRPL